MMKRGNGCRRRLTAFSFHRDNSGIRGRFVGDIGRKDGINMRMNRRERKEAKEKLRQEEWEAFIRKKYLIEGADEETVRQYILFEQHFGERWRKTLRREQALGRGYKIIMRICSAEMIVIVVLLIAAVLRKLFI